MVRPAASNGRPLMLPTPIPVKELFTASRSPKETVPLRAPQAPNLLHSPPYWERARVNIYGPEGKKKRQGTFPFRLGGGYRSRTDDLLNANQVL